MTRLLNIRTASLHLRLGLMTRLVLALAFLGAATLLRLAIVPLHSGFTFTTYYPAIVFVFFFCGRWPGYLFLVVSAAIGVLYFSPGLASNVTLPADVAGVVLYILSGFMVGYLVDFLHRTIRDLEASERRYQGILDDQTDWVSRIRADGTVTYMNEAVRRTFGAIADQVTNKPWQLAVFADDIPMVEQELRKISVTKPVVTIENRVYDAAGHVIWGQFINRGIFSEDGTLLELQVVGRDVTQRRELENRLATMSRELTDLHDNAPCGYHGLAADGTILYVNKRELSWLGARRDEVVGRAKITDFFTEEGRELFQRKMPQFLAEGQLDGFEADLVSRDGSRRRVSVTANALYDVEGRYLSSRSVMFDISDRYRADQEIRRLNAELEQRVERRTAELKQSNEELESFSYSVSHDLRAPLRAVNALASIMLEDHAAELSVQGRELLGRIREAGLRMGLLVDDLLVLSRLGRDSLQWTQVDQADLVRRAVADLRAQVPDATIEFRIADLPPCPGDAMLLRPVWSNLLANAVKFSRGRQPAVIEVGCEAADGEYIYFVRDNGVGFDMQFADRLFKVFERLHDSAQFEGTGVGLAIVERVMARLGGRVWAQSQPGAGATIRFALRRTRSA